MEILVMKITHDAADWHKNTPLCRVLLSFEPA